MVLLLDLFTTLTAWSTNMSYYDPTAVVGEQLKTATNVTAITSSTTVLGTEGTTTWYYVTSTVTNDNRINVIGTVNIILVDNCNFTASKGIRVADNEGHSNKLNIYAQSAGSTCGILTATHSGKDAGIGGDGIDGMLGGNGEDSGAITIYGGNISINGNLGGGNGGNFFNKLLDKWEDPIFHGGKAGYGGDGTVAIYGGNITVNGNLGGGDGGIDYSKDKDTPKDKSHMTGNTGGGSISLKWTNSSDRFYAKSYNGNVTLLNDFVDEYGIEFKGQYEIKEAFILNHVTLIPDIGRNSITISNTSCLKANKKKAAEGDEVILTAINGYTVSNVTVTDADNGNVSVRNSQNGTWTFTMPAKSVTVTATATKTHYKITESKGISFKINDNDKLVQDGITYYKQGASIQLVLTPPSEAYELQSLSVKRDDNGNEIDATLSGSTYSFTMPAADVTLSATYAINFTGLTLLEGTTDFTVTKGTTDYSNGNYVLYPDNIESDDLKEGCTRLLDGKYSSTDTNHYTKWCLSVLNENNPCYVEFNTDEPVIPKKYVLITGNDNNKYTGRNPKSWKILAKESKDDETWTVIADVTNDQTMEDENYTAYTFDFNNVDDKTYKYFRFEIYSTQSNGIMQLSEMQMYVKKASDYELAGSTLYCDGNWQTLCLPFSLANLNGTPLEGFTVMELDTVAAYNNHVTGIDGETLYLNFKPATSIEAGKPYIVKKLEAPVDDSTTPIYEATNGTEGWTTQQECGYKKLFDGKTGSGYNWWPNFANANGSVFCEFNAEEPVYVTSYTLISGNQKVAQDPMIWTLQAKLSKSAPWTVIDSRDATKNNSDAVNSNRSQPKDYTIQKPGAYMYFRFEVTANGGAGNMCLSELTMHGYYLGEPINVENPTFEGITISSNESVPVTSSDGLLTFCGSYGATSIDGGDKSKLLFDTDNTLYYPTDATQVGANRALLSLKSPVNLGLLTDIVLGTKDAIPAANLNDDSQVDILDITTLIDNILNNCPPLPTITTVVSNVNLGLGH